MQIKKLRLALKKLSLIIKIGFEENEIIPIFKKIVIFLAILLVSI